MSKVGKKPIEIKSGVSIEEKDGFILVKGPKGELSIKKLPYVSVEIRPNEVEVKLEKNIKQGKSNWGTLRSLLNGAITGVSDGFVKELEINGVGFKANIEGDSLILNIGFSHPVKMSIPKGIEIKIEKNIIKVSGFDKDLVGRTAADIRATKKPEPYKGKGIKYVSEVIMRKAGKKAVGSGS